MKKLMLVITGLAMTLTTMAGPGSIQGKVMMPDEDGKLVPAEFANVYVETMGGPVGGTTDLNGRFHINPLDPGLYNLTVSYIGFHPLVVEVRVNPDKVARLGELELTPDNVLKEFVKKADPNKYSLINAEDPTAMPILWKDIENNPNQKNLQTLVASTVPGVYQKDEGQPLYFRGARSGSVAYFIDGVKSFDESLNVPSTAVGSMTVYTGGVPARYGDLLGGAVIVETKTYFELYTQRQNELYLKEQEEKAEREAMQNQL